MIDDNSDAKSIVKRMNHHPKAYFLVNPQSHYANSMAIYTALKRNLDAKNYGVTKKKGPKSFIDSTPGEPEKISFKGTPFHQCEIPYDVFHMSRRTKLTIK